MYFFYPIFCQKIAVNVIHWGFKMGHFNDSESLLRLGSFCSYLCTEAFGTPSALCGAPGTLGPAAEALAGSSRRSSGVPECPRRHNTWLNTDPTRPIQSSSSVLNTSEGRG